jgi:malate/lactate dehydrogenase
MMKLQSSHEDWVRENLALSVSSKHQDMKSVNLRNTEQLQHPAELISVQSIKLDINKLKTEMLQLNERQNQLDKPVVWQSKDTEIAVCSVVNYELADIAKTSSQCCCHCLRT